MQPLGIEHVDLANVLTQRGKAGSIPLDVKRGPDAFVRVQGDLGRRFLGFATRAQSRLLALLFFFLTLLFFQRVIRTLLFGKKQPRQLLVANGRINKEDDQQRDAHAKHVKKPAQPAPAGLRGIVENRFRHWASHHRMMRLRRGSNSDSGRNHAGKWLE